MSYHDTRGYSEYGASQDAAIAEEWRAVPGWPRYEVSSIGGVRSIDHVDTRGQRRKGRVLH